MKYRTDQGHIEKMRLQVNGRYFQFQVAITLASVDVVQVGYKNINHTQIINERTQFVCRVQNYF
jgi:seryl-tRNA(Sec) selenium transferase